MLFFFLNLLTIPFYFFVTNNQSAEASVILVSFFFLIFNVIFLTAYIFWRFVIQNSEDLDSESYEIQTGRLSGIKRPGYFL